MKDTIFPSTSIGRGKYCVKIKFTILLYTYFNI